MTKPLAQGFRPQLYRSKLPGRNAVEQRRGLAVALKEFKTLGCPGVVFHGFSVELPAAWDDLAKMAADAGLEALAAFGMDSTDPAGKGRRIGAVAAKPSCTAVVIDAEGAWEAASADVENQNAKELRLALRAQAPDAIVIDQPWPVPTVHWTNFPWEEMSALADIRAPQYYFNDWTRQYGTRRFSILERTFDVAWLKLEARLQPQGLVKPRTVTLQGYSWSDICPDLVTCLLRYPSAIIWCEPFPTREVRIGLRAIQLLSNGGFTGPDAVKNFQAANGLTADGICGPVTINKIGLSWRQVFC